MTDNSSPAADQSLTGQMFLYRRPQLLTREEHGALGLTPPARPFDFVADKRAIPITRVEFSSAQRFYPIVFSEVENPTPLAVVGVLEDVNLFVDAEGQWDPLCYVPSYLRRYPFALASSRDGQMAAVIDRDAPAVSEQPQYPFFDGDAVSEHTDKMMTFCGQFEAEQQRTREFCNRLVELQLLTAQRTTYRPEGATEDETMESYVSVDVQKLNDLPDDIVVDLHRKGQLSAIYLQVYSLENWRYLMARRVARQQGAS